MIQAEPDAPTVMIECNGENDGERQENRYDCFVVRANQRKTCEVSNQNHQLSCDDVDRYGSYEEAFFALEEGIARRAVESDMERSFDD